MARQAKNTQGSEASSLSRARLINRLIFGIALFGLLLTLHLWIQSERGFSHGCFGLDDPAEVGIVECSVVVQSDAGKLFGISNIIYGFFFFGVIAALSFASILTKGDSTTKFRRASLIAASLGMAYALYLFGYQVFILGQFCKLCLTTGLTTAVVFLLHALEWAGKTTVKYDLAELVREVGLFILMILVAAMLLIAEVFFLNRIGTLETSAVAVGAATALPEPSGEPVSPVPGVDTADLGGEEQSESATEVDEASPDAVGASQLAEPAPDPDVLAARLDQMCRYDTGVAEVSNVDALTRDAPYLGSDSAGVRLVEFFDPNCPHCKTLHSETPAIMARLAGRARIVYKPFPIWPFSFPQVEALYQANDEGLFHEMLTAQMNRQQRGGLSVDDLTEIAGEIGMDRDQFRRDLNAGKYRTRVNRERAQISRLGISAVPKMTVEGRFVQAASVNPICLEHFVTKLETQDS